MKRLLGAGAVLLLAAVLAGGSASASSVGATCSSTAPATTTPAKAPSTGLLVPKGATSLLLCRYHGLNPPATASRLSASAHVTSASKIRAIVSQFDALPAVTAVFHCPMDDGSEITAAFGYPHSGTQMVALGLTGCRTASRDGINRNAALRAGSRLIAELEKLLRR